MNPSFHQRPIAFPPQTAIGETTPLSAAEIESLLRAAQRSQTSPANFDSAEELGPGDVQHFRGTAENPVNQPIDTINPLEALSTIDESLQQTEQHLSEALIGSHFATMDTPIDAPPVFPTAISANSPGGLTLDDLGHVDLDISIELGRTDLPIEEILKLRAGSVVSLDRSAGDPVDIVANGRLVARGELLVIDGKFGVRLSEVL